MSDPSSGDDKIDGFRDHDHASGRVKRYAAVTSTVGGLATKFAFSKVFGIDLDKGAHADELKRALGGLKGPLMKVAQILATIPDALPDEYVAEFSQLQSNAPAMGWLFVKRRMAAELGRDWLTKFGRFEHEAVAAASLGQVHRASLTDGTPLACKLQYPEMGAAVEADLRQLKMLFQIYKSYDGTIDPSQIGEEIEDRLREELDYIREAKQMALYRAMLADEDHVRVPDVVDELTTTRLLTMTWLDGQRVLEFKDDHADRRNGLARDIFMTWYKPLFGYGVIHGDPHLGNYTVADDGRINLLDFGCVRIFHPRFIAGVIDLYHATLHKDRDLAVHAYRTWGFEGLTNEMVDTLNLWAEFLFDAWIDDRVRPLQESTKSAGIFGREVAQKVVKRLREIGGVTPPREFVFMDRAALGMGSVFMHLGAELNWHNLIHEVMDGFDVDALQAKQADALAAAGLEAHPARAA